MPAVAIFPREERGHQRGVEDEAYRVVHPCVFAEGAVAAFVAYDPDTRHECSLDEPVEGPSHIVEWGGKDGDVSLGNVEKSRANGEVISKVGQRADKGAVEAMGRNGFLECGKREWRLVTGDSHSLLLLAVLLFIFIC
ncbi:hypothetical protein Tsubulata_041437 [Turnera subulata]|uniref:Uncharacterized protein n=1 Tax=Turnera subulata TaxID=218843 RepID=A0A9Q0JMX5_9ROSI|nr:hypothetical protein Tsubulata_041437 [Turnera subulata]